MLDVEFSLRDDFPPIGYEQWRAIAEADLHGASFDQKLVTHSYEGIDIQPVYCRRDELGPADPFGFPGSPPFVRGSRPLGATVSGWDLRQEYAHPDLAVTNRAILDDLAGGATSLHLRLDLAARNGLNPDDPAAVELAGHDGVMAYDVHDLDEALSEVELPSIGVSLEAGAAFLPAAALIVALWRRRNVSPERARGILNADPLAVLARDGLLPYSLATAMSQLGDLTRSGHRRTTQMQRQPASTPRPTTTPAPQSIRTSRLVLPRPLSICER